MAKSLFYEPPFKATHYKSLKTGNLYPKEDYANHGWGVPKHGFKDLPADEYPYTLVYQPK